jgi:carboxypeptidase Taq
MTGTALERMTAHMAELNAVKNAAAVLGWDQQTSMPPGGAAARADQFGALSKIIHGMATGSDTARLLEAAELETNDQDPDSDAAAYVRVARRDFDRATKLPTALVSEIARTSALAHEQWAQARAENDYARFAPWLEKNLDLTRQVAGHLGYGGGEMYDALLNQYEPGMKTVEVRAMFEAIKPTLVGLVKAIAAQGPDAGDDSVLRRLFPEASQEAFGRQVVSALGFDWTRGRQDRAVHPFCTSFTRGDVRITTRFDQHFLPTALFGSMHETGHALYEQGVAPRYDGNVLGGGASLGVHESQSRLWENLVGRSRPFWQRYYADLQAAFPDALSEIGAETWYRAINSVSPSLIRVEADEVTYNLHILLRFELEVEMLEGRLSVVDAPAAWNAKMEQYLGLTPPDDAQGILQDVHWSGGSMGYFPTYSVGNLLSVQLFEKADESLGGQTAALIANGDFSPLLGWLRENVYQWGRKYEPSVLVRKITGGPLDPTPYLRYLMTKFGEIYDLPSTLSA